MAHGNFDNDDAMDWVLELKDTEGLEPISTAFGLILGIGDGYLEAPEACRGLAAAEVVAALLGKPAAKMPDEVTAWAKGRNPPNEELVKSARQVVTRVLKDSELKDLCAESPKAVGLWQKETEDLLRRLGPTPKKRG